MSLGAQAGRSSRVLMVVLAGGPAVNPVEGAWHSQVKLKQASHRAGRTAAGSCKAGLHNRTVSDGAKLVEVWLPGRPAPLALNRGQRLRARMVHAQDLIE